MTRARAYPFCQSPVSASDAAQGHPPRRYAARPLSPRRRRDCRGKRLRPVEITRIDVERHWIVPTRWLRRRVDAKSFYPPRMLRMAYRIKSRLCRRRTSSSPPAARLQMPNICVTRFLNVPNVFCGSLLRGLGPQNFSLVISSYDRDAGSARHIVVLKPSAIDPDTLGRPAKRCRSTARRTTSHALPDCSSAEMPGPSATESGGMGEAAWILRSPVQAWGTRWLVSTSRRTPDRSAT